MSDAVRCDIRDGLSPFLRDALGKMRDKRPILRVAADAVKSYSDLAFSNPRFRLSPWAPKKDGTPATLKGNPPKLARSLMCVPVSNDAIEIGSDRPYARAQNYGFSPRRLPARPFLAIDKDGRIAPFAEAAVRAAIERKIESMLGK